MPFRFQRFCLEDKVELPCGGVGDGRGVSGDASASILEIGWRIPGWSSVVA